MPKKINQREYQYYIIRNNSIIEGFGDKDDAFERKSEMDDPKLKVFSKTYLKTRLNIDPDDNSSWGNLKREHKLREAADSINIGKTKPCRIKKVEGQYRIFRINQGDNTEIPALNSGFETKEMAERAAQLRGYVLVDADGQVQEYEFAKLPKANDARSSGYKPKANKIEYIEEVIRRILTKVSKKKLNEATIAPDIEKKIDELAQLQEQLQSAEAQMKALMDKLESELNVKAMKKRYDELLKGELWDFFEKMKHEEQRIIQTKKYYLEVKKYQAEVLTYDNVKTLEYAMTQVNQDVKYNILLFQKGTEKLSKRAGDIVVKKTESRLTEDNWLTKIVNLLSSLISPVLAKITQLDSRIDKNLKIISGVLKGQ